MVDYYVVGACADCNAMWLCLVGHAVPNLFVYWLILPALHCGICVSAKLVDGCVHTVQERNLAQRYVLGPSNQTVSVVWSRTSGFTTMCAAC